MRSARPLPNLYSLMLRPVVAHGGEGNVDAIRILERGDGASACDFVDYVELPRGTSIGDHRHRLDEEEYYLVLAGTGMLQLDRETFAVTAGDLARNPPGGLHGLRNTGDTALKLFVFQVPVVLGRS